MTLAFMGKSDYQHLQDDPLTPQVIRFLGRAQALSVELLASVTA